MRCVLLLVMCSQLAPAQAPARPRGGGGSGSPVPGFLQFNGALSKLFGEHKAFTAQMEIEVRQGSADENMTMPTKLSFLDGNSRIELDLARAKGPQIPPAMAEQFKAMGIAEMTMLSRSDKQTAFLICPGLLSYAEMKPEGGAGDADKVKVQTSEIGKESMDGHACVKNKVMVTDAAGKATESTVWNATDMKGFPVRIETADGKDKVTMKLKDVKFTKPASALFDPPAAYTRYADVQVMMQEGVMKKMLGGAGAKPAK
ncbi:MAG: hypothetical protein QOF48_444 [Verrucomicrobiota bacterium]